MADIRYYEGKHGFRINEALQERIRQDEKFGFDRNQSPFIWLAVLGEEVGEVNKAVLEEDSKNYAEELIQVTAVCLAMLQNLDDHGFKL